MHTLSQCDRVMMNDTHPLSEALVTAFRILSIKSSSGCNARFMFRAKSLSWLDWLDCESLIGKFIASEKRQSQKVRLSFLLLLPTIIIPHRSLPPHPPFCTLSTHTSTHNNTSLCINLFLQQYLWFPPCNFQNLIYTYFVSVNLLWYQFNASDCSDILAPVEGRLVAWNRVPCVHLVPPSAMLERHLWIWNRVLSSSLIGAIRNSSFWLRRG
jgi:hypothetical protein